jgi:hypothetical protein
MAMGLSVTYNGYLIRPGNSDPTYNDYEAWIVKGASVIDTVKSYTWTSCVAEAKKRIDLLPVYTPGLAKPKPTQSSKPVVPAKPVQEQVADAMKALADEIAAHNARWSTPIEVEAQVSTPIRHEKYVPIIKKLSQAEVANAPYLNLNEAIYEAEYKPQGWHLLIIGPTATWRQEWKEWEAIRDIVQNALDESEQYTYGNDDSGLWIADKGRGISISDFLLGPAKLKPDYARGKFGEGMKVSALVLTRLGYRVHVRTSDKDLWICYYEQEVGGGNTAMTLAALWKESTAYTGTIFNIIGYNGNSYSKYFAVNIPKSTILQRSPSSLDSPIPRFNTIYKATAEFPATLYCRDIYLQKITSKYSYNLWGFELSPDRHGPKSESDVDQDVGRTWACVTDQSMIEDLISMTTGHQESGRISPYETTHVNLSSWYLGRPAYPDGSPAYSEIMAKNKDVWIRAFKNVCGQNTVVQTNSKFSAMVEHLGYNSVSVGYNMDALKDLLPTDESVVSRALKDLRTTKVIPDEQLTPAEAVDLLLARAICRKVIYGNQPSIYAAIIPVTPNTPGQTVGYYDPTLNEIYISVSILDTGVQTVDTTIHELAHVDSGGAGDLTQAHAAAMTKIASRVFRSVSLGSFDKYLKDQDFKWE